MAAAKDLETRGAFIAMRLTGDTVDYAATACGISRATAKRWWKAYQEQSEVEPGVQPVEPQNRPVVVSPKTMLSPRERIGEQLLEYVSESLETLRSQAIFGRDTTWLERQRANELASFYGVIADKAVRVLAAIQAASASE